ncbi:MAG: flavoprotein, partial [Nitrososphaerales archaeon]
MRLLIGISGSSGVAYGIRLLEVLKTLKIETHLIISRWAEECIKLETDKKASYAKSLAKYVYSNDNLAAKPSSGSYRMD